jgi:hypothetical protein
MTWLPATRFKASIEHVRQTGSVSRPHSSHWLISKIKWTFKTLGFSKSKSKQSSKGKRAFNLCFKTLFSVKLYQLSASCWLSIESSSVLLWLFLLLVLLPSAISFIHYLQTIASLKLRWVPEVWWTATEREDPLVSRNGHPGYYLLLHVTTGAMPTANLEPSPFLWSHLPDISKHQ